MFFTVLGVINLDGNRTRIMDLSNNSYKIRYIATKVKQFIARSRIAEQVISIVEC